MCYAPDLPIKYCLCGNFNEFINLNMRRLFNRYNVFFKTVKIFSAKKIKQNRYFLFLCSQNIQSCYKSILTIGSFYSLVFYRWPHALL